MSKAAPKSAVQVRTGLFITAVGGLLFTLDLPLLRLSMADRWTMVFARGVFIFLSISLAWFVLRKVSGKAVPFLAGGAGVAVALANLIANIAYVGATVETNAANVVFIIALVPVLTAAMSNIFVREPVHAYTWLAIVGALAGVAIIVWGGLQDGHWVGDMLALLAATCTAATFTVIRATGKNVATSLATGSLLSALIALFFFGASIPSLGQSGAFGVTAVYWLALNGLVAIPLATMLMANGPRYLPSTDVSMFFLLETTLTPVWVWLLFGEAPTNTALLGGMIVILTLLAHSWWRLRSTIAFAPAE